MDLQIDFVNASKLSKQITQKKVKITWSGATLENSTSGITLKYTQPTSNYLVAAAAAKIGIFKKANSTNNKKRECHCR